jgi:hypothetical protein
MMAGQFNRNRYRTAITGFLKAAFVLSCAVPSFGYAQAPVIATPQVTQASTQTQTQAPAQPPSQFDRPNLTSLVPTTILDVQQLKVLDGFNVLERGKRSELVLTRSGEVFKPTYINDETWVDPLNTPFQNRRTNVVPVDFSDFLSQSSEVWTAQTLAGNRDRLYFLSSMAARVCPPLADAMNATTIRFHNGDLSGPSLFRIMQDYSVLSNEASLPPLFRDAPDALSALFGIEKRLVGPAFTRLWNERLESCLGREISQATPVDRAVLTLRLRYLGETLAQLPPLPVRASIIVRTASRASNFEGVSLDLPTLSLNELSALVYESRAPVCSSSEFAANNTRNWCSAALINEANLRGWSVKPGDGDRYEIVPYNGESARQLLAAARGQSLSMKPNRSLEWRADNLASNKPAP